MRQGQVQHFPIAVDFTAQLVIPRDLGEVEAARLCAFIKALVVPFAPNDAPPVISSMNEALEAAINLATLAARAGMSIGTMPEDAETDEELLEFVGDVVEWMEGRELGRAIRHQLEFETNRLGECLRGHIKEEVSDAS